MVLGAPFWSIVTINAGFLLLGLEARKGIVSRFWLIAPLVWFGGYGLFAWRSHHEVNEIAAKVAEYNSGKKVAFDPGRNSLVFDGAEGIVQNYDLWIAYRNREKIGGKGYFGYFVADPSTCVRLRQNERIWGYYISKYDWKDYSRTLNSCVIQAEVAPDRAQVIVSAHGSNSYVGKFIEYTITDLRVDGPLSGADLQVGSATPYSWFPLPQIGCFLNEGAGKWQCGAEFMKGNTETIGPYTSEKVVAAALDLTPSSVKSRLASIAAGNHDSYLENLRKAIGAP